MRRLKLDENGGLKFTQNIADVMQQAYTEIFKAIGAAFGNKVILTGCVVAGGNVTDGWILYNGEPIKFIGGVLNTKVSITETSTNCDFKNGISRAVIFNKTATCGVAGVFDFSELRSIRELATLNDLVTTLDTNLTALTAAFNNYTPSWADISGKPLGYISYIGTYQIGDIATDEIHTITIPNQGTNDYIVSGSLVGQTGNYDYENDVSWIITEQTATTFKIGLREYASEAQNLRFDFTINKTS